MARVKPPRRQLETKTPWRQGQVYYHRNVRVECVAAQQGRYWRCKGYLHRSPDQAMDRAEGKPLGQIMHGIRPETVAKQEDAA